ncbi:MAG: ABC transporter ATP-binding protein [Ruminococcaceae bacterium]|nr:ABC transporter ATP-binding protein [Oscillospiraceae bacterium]
MIVEMNGICKDYLSAQNTVRVLRNVSLRVEKGDYIAIMGPSGSGKTTLMNILGFLDLPTSGEYLFDGRDLTNSGDDELAEVRNKHIGFVFQSFYLLPRLTAVENVALPLLYADVPPKERIRRAEEALKMVGLEERMNFYPNQLSGGQCQRVAIARAIVGRPELLLADEPTGALDSLSGNQIMDIFQQLNASGITIIMITHEQSVADCADRIYHILDGEIIENGEQEHDSRSADYEADYDGEEAYDEDEPEEAEEQSDEQAEEYDEENCEEEEYDQSDS